MKIRRDRKDVFKMNSLQFRRYSRTRMSRRDRRREQHADQRRAARKTPKRSRRENLKWHLESTSLVGTNGGNVTVTPTYQEETPRRPWNNSTTLSGRRANSLSGTPTAKVLN